MAVLTKSTDIVIKDQERLVKLFCATPNPSKEAFDRIAKAKRSPLFKGKKLSLIHI